MKKLSDIIKFNSNTGIFVPDLLEIKNDITDMLINDVFREEIDTTSETPIGRIIEFLSRFLYGCLSVCAETANQINLNYSTGSFLDALGSLYLVSRKPKTRSNVQCVLYGTPNTLIPSGSLIRDKQGNSFSLDNDTTISENGSVIAEFHSVEYGAVPCSRNTLTTIDTPVDGWNSVNNVIDGDIGADTESDSSFRERIINSRSYGTSSIHAIRNAILNIPDVDKCFIFENNTGGVLHPKNNDAVNVPAHSLYICVLGGNENDVARAIADKKTIGCGYCMQEGLTGASLKNVAVIYESMYSTNVYFYIPTSIHVPVRLKISNINVVDTSSINEIIKSFISQQEIGVEITYQDLLIYIFNNSRINILDISFSLNNYTKKSFIVPCYRYAVTEDSDILIEAV